LGQSEVTIYTIASDAKWMVNSARPALLSGGPPTAIPFAIPTSYDTRYSMVTVPFASNTTNGEWRKSSRRLGPMKYLDANKSGFPRPWFFKTEFEASSITGSFALVIHSKLDPVYVPEDVPLTALVLVSYHDATNRRSILLERVLRAYLLMSTEPHDPEKVRSLWTELCLIDSGE
jgi:hypothetical protein